MKINILGTSYEVVRKKFSEEPEFERRSICGYCDSLTKQIVICKMDTFPEWENEPPERCKAHEKHCIRHEIVHAFFNESGLMDSSFDYEGPWARNEEMVDWLACQGPKIYEAWKQGGGI